MKRKVKYDYAFKRMCRIGLKKHYSDGYVSKLKQIPR
jgi:transposase